MFIFAVARALRLGKCCWKKKLQETARVREREVVGRRRREEQFEIYFYCALSVVKYD